MSRIISQKMRYARKLTPEERRDEKFHHFAESSSDSIGGEPEEEPKPLLCTKRSKKSKHKGKRRVAEEAHVAMCQKAMKTMERINKLLNKYGILVLVNKSNPL